MATDYPQVPTLADRIGRADIIVLGSIGRIIDVQPDETEGVRRVFGVFELHVEDLLNGDQPTGAPLLRVVGDGEDERARWLIPVNEGQRLVLFLARDIGPGIPDDTFALVHASGFELEDDGRMRVPEEAVDDLTRRVADFDGSQVSLDGLQRLVELVRQERDEAARQVAGLLPEEALTRPYPEVEERPDVAVPSLAPGPAGVTQARPSVIHTAGDTPAGDAGGAGGADPAR